MIEDTLNIATNDGDMETFVCRPERGGPYPAIFFLMDAPGIREELRVRLEANHGPAVTELAAQI